MGRFAPGHYDDVFVSKFKKLISSSLNKSRTSTPESSDDDTAPSPVQSAWTFEKFVVGLDDADPFIVALVDVLVKEVTSRTQNGGRSNHTEWDGTYAVPTMASDTAEALRQLLHCSRIGSPVATERIWDAVERTGAPPPRVRPQSRMAFSPATADLVNATRDMRGNAPNVSPPHESASDAYDPLFDAFYGDPTEPFGGTWTSRFGMSPPPPPPPRVLIPPPANSLPDPLPDTIPLSPGPSRERPSSLSERIIDFRRASEGRSARSLDFASYSARRRALHRSISRSQLEDRRERNHSPALWDAEIGFLEGDIGRDVNGRSDTEPDIEIDFVSSRHPIRPLRRPTVRNAMPDSPPRADFGHLSSSRRNNDESSHPVSLDYLRHRLEAYPRRGSYGTPTDDPYNRAGPSSLSIRPPHTALLLTQGRSSSRSRSPVSVPGPRVVHRPLRRQALRAPETLEAELEFPRHSSLPPSGVSGDSHEVSFVRSPSPWPNLHTTADDTPPSDAAVPTSEDVANSGATNEREDSLPPPLVRLMVPRAATPELA